MIIYLFEKFIYRVFHLIKTLLTKITSLIYKIFEPARFNINTDKTNYSFGETIVADLFINANRNLLINKLVVCLICKEHFQEVFIRSEIPKSSAGMLSRNQPDIPLDPINTQVIKESNKILLEEIIQIQENIEVTRKQNYHITTNIKVPLKLPAHSVGSKLNWHIELKIQLEEHNKNRALIFPINISK